MRPSEILDMHREELRAVLKRPKYAAHFTNLRVFGSVATGDDTEQSDIDFLIDSKDKSYTLFDLSGLYYTLENITQTKIDLVVSDQLSPRMKKIVLKEAKPV